MGMFSESLEEAYDKIKELEAKILSYRITIKALAEDLNESELLDFYDKHFGISTAREGKI